MSHFFAYLYRLRYILRWGLKRNETPENVVEHTFDVAIIAHSLALIKNTYYGGTVDANAVAVAALYHDASEVLTGDVPTPIKYSSESLRRAYKALEAEAARKLQSLVPDELQPAYAQLLIEENVPEAHMRLIKAADIISALIKCRSELGSGNREFEKALSDVQSRLAALDDPEVLHWMQTFGPSFDLTLDELI